MTHTHHLPGRLQPLTPVGVLREGCARLARALDTRLEDVARAIETWLARVNQPAQPDEETQQ